MNTQAPGRQHNQPPDPIDEAIAPYSDAIDEAQNWLDGEPVRGEAQMKAVDALLKQIRAALKDAKAGEESESKPVYDQWKAIKARWKPTLDDLERIKKGLTACVDGYKRKLAAERAEAERKAREEAEAKRRAAEEAARKADEANIEAQRGVAQAQAEAEASQKAAAQASRQAKEIKGLRTVTRYEVTDHRALLHWIAKNDREAMTEFVEEYARRHHAPGTSMDGVKVWKERVAY